MPEPTPFPPVRVASKNGLLAVGGDLGSARLLCAYRNGIFPWFGPGEPIMWWAPDPRMVLFPRNIHVSRSLQKVLRKNLFRVTVNGDFASVITACAALRRRGVGGGGAGDGGGVDGGDGVDGGGDGAAVDGGGGGVDGDGDGVAVDGGGGVDGDGDGGGVDGGDGVDGDSDGAAVDGGDGADGGGGTWITPAMQRAYRRLHREGFAHSVEVWRGDVLVGGLYGVAVGRAFFGESMFSIVTDASKVALVHLARQLAAWDFALIDCQLSSAHLASMGAREISREEFMHRLADAVRQPPPAWPSPARR